MLLDPRPHMLRSAFVAARNHTRILTALILRETITRYGREGIGFVWLFIEPLIFCFGVMALWTLLKPEYEHGIRVAPFVMTGYMCLLLFRHMTGALSGAIPANVGLMHHRRVRPLHIYLSRVALEVGGGIMAFFIVYITLLCLQAVSPPHDVLLLYSGYFILAWLSAGFALVLASLAIQYEVAERILPVFMYIMIPLSGAFIMVDWLPDQYQWIYLLNPLPHTIEMVRSAVFGEFVPTHYNPLYPISWAAGLTLLGLLLMARAQRYLEVD